MGNLEFKPVKEYEIINDNLGSGSFGITKLIKDPSINELFVCKKYAPQVGINKKVFYENFKKEIKLMYKINHQNVVRVFTYYLYESHYTGYIIMEYIEGTNIEEWFKDYFISNVSVNDVFRQLIEGFNCLEENGIIHRDIRESNILISNDGKAKIIDFGLGKDLNSCEISYDSFNEIINRANMEKLPNEFSQKKYTSKTDMFCIAELFDRMIKKYKINDFEHNYILQKMMNPDPTKRYESFKTILNSLDKKDFKKLNISEEDREVYNSFVLSLHNCLSVFLEAKKFEVNPDVLINNIGEVLEKNVLNYNIEDTAELIRIFVKCKYKYFPNRKISVLSLHNFYSWIIQKDENFQQIVLKNIISKLSSIQEKEEIDLPF